MPTAETESANARNGVPTVEVESANTSPGVPTESANATDESANTSPEVPTLDMDIPEALAAEGLEAIDIANTEFDVNTRMEPRYNEHGKLRGIVWRKKDKGRKTTWYVGAKSTGQKKEQYDNLKPKFEK